MGYSSLAWSIITQACVLLYSAASGTHGLVECWLCRAWQLDIIHKEPFGQSYLPVCLL